MRKGILTGVAGAVLFVLASVPAWSADCLSPKEKSAFSVRFLQTSLMVAALTCGERADYNVFVSKFRRVLVHNGKALKAFFNVRYGKDGPRRLNRYVTSLSNRLSDSTLDHRKSYCSAASQLFDAVLAQKSGELEGFSVRRARQRSFPAPACAPSMDVADVTSPDQVGNSR